MWPSEICVPLELLGNQMSTPACGGVVLPLTKRFQRSVAGHTTLTACLCVLHTNLLSTTEQKETKFVTSKTDDERLMQTVSFLNTLFFPMQWESLAMG